MTHPLVQNYTYDSLNRIATATETSNSAQTWKQSFKYDRFGNRNFDRPNTTVPASFANPAITDPAVSPSTNRIRSTGFLYDTAGNTTRDGAYQTYSYDAENKQIEVRNSSSAILGQYAYDGDGKRVKKHVPGTGETTIFVYDAGGTLVAEYSTIVQSSANAKVSYLTNDHLGSPRINTDQNGAVISRHDYHPFGEEIDGTGGRTTGLNYGDDTVRQQFTGYERDGETGLDFAQARYHSFTTGRFSTPDRFNGERISPQSLNQYVYVLNNPLNLVDPSGYCGTTSGSVDGSKCLWLSKDGEYQSVSETDYGDGSNFDGWSRVEDIDSVVLENPVFSGSYANVEKYQSFQQNKISVQLGSDGMFYGVNNSVNLEESGSPQGYIDANVNISALGVGFTGGTMFNSTTGRPSPYAGIGFFTPGSPVGGSLQYSPDSISGGFNAEVNAGLGGFVGNVGIDEAGNIFQGGPGPGTPGASLTFYYVFNTPRPPIASGTPTNWSRQNSASNVSPSDIPRGTPNCACNVPR